MPKTKKLTVTHSPSLPDTQAAKDDPKIVGRFVRTLTADRFKALPKPTAVKFLHDEWCRVWGDPLSYDLESAKGDSLQADRVSYLDYTKSLPSEFEPVEISVICGLKIKTVKGQLLFNTGLVIVKSSDWIGRKTTGGFICQALTGSILAVWKNQKQARRITGALKATGYDFNTDITRLKRNDIGALMCFIKSLDGTQHDHRRSY